MFTLTAPTNGLPRWQLHGSGSIVITSSSQERLQDLMKSIQDLRKQQTTMTAGITSTQPGDLPERERDDNGSE